MKKLSQLIPHTAKMLGGTALIFFLIALAISHNVINAGIWGLFGAYLCTGLLLNDAGLSRLVYINLPPSLILLVASIINISHDLVNMPSFLPNADVLNISIVMFIFSGIGLIILPIGEAIDAHEEYLKELESI